MNLKQLAIAFAVAAVATATTGRLGTLGAQEDVGSCSDPDVWCYDDTYDEIEESEGGGDWNYAPCEDRPGEKCGWRITTKTVRACTQWKVVSASGEVNITTNKPAAQAGYTVTCANEQVWTQKDSIELRRPRIGGNQ